MVRSLLVCAVVAACAVVMASATADVTDHGVSSFPTPEAFAQWMSRGDEVWTGDEPVPEMRQKFLRRVLSWAVNEVTDMEKYDWEAVKRAFNYNFKDGETAEDLKNMLFNAIFSDELTPWAVNEDGNYQTVSADSYPFFGFIPPFTGSMLINGPALTFDT